MCICGDPADGHLSFQSSKAAPGAEAAASCLVPPQGSCKDSLHLKSPALTHLQGIRLCLILTLLVSTCTAAQRQDARGNGTGDRSGCVKSA